MLKGLAITPPVLGRISIGKVVERNGKRLPEKFNIIFFHMSKVFAARAASPSRQQKRPEEFIFRSEPTRFVIRFCRDCRSVC